MKSLAVLLFLTTSAVATEHYAGEYDNVDPATRAWFKSVRSPHGVPCCDIADGHHTQAKQSTRTEEEIQHGMSEWWTVVEGEWMQVPLNSVVYNAGNPTGDAVVWYTRQGGGAVYIRCFVPGGGV